LIDGKSNVFIHTADPEMIVLFTDWCNKHLADEAAL